MYILVVYLLFPCETLPKDTTHTLAKSHLQPMPDSHSTLMTPMAKNGPCLSCG